MIDSSGQLTLCFEIAEKMLPLRGEMHISNSTVFLVKVCSTILTDLDEKDFFIPYSSMGFSIIYRVVQPVTTIL